MTPGQNSKTATNRQTRREGYGLCRETRRCVGKPLGKWQATSVTGITLLLALSACASGKAVGPVAPPSIHSSQTIPIPPHVLPARAAAASEKQASSIVPVKKARKAPDFALPDTKGVSRRLTGFRGRPVALFFFCGCSACLKVARAWSPLQRGGALTVESITAAPGSKTGKAPLNPILPDPSTSPVAPVAPITIIVYSGDASGAEELATKAGLDMSPDTTVLLTDPEMRVTDGLYHFESCPRAVVLDPSGVIRYTNDSKEDAPRIAPAEIIVTHTLDALRHTPEHAVGKADVPKS